MRARLRQLTLRTAMAAVAVTALAVGLGYAASPSAAVAQSGTCFDPVPDLIAAGWTVEGTQPIQGGAAPLILNDGSTALGEFVNLFCPVAAPLIDEIVLRPRLTVDPGFNPAGGNTGIHVTIGDGSRAVRAVLLAAGPAVLRVAIDVGGGSYSQGFMLNSLSAEFILKRLANGNALLALPSGETEEIGRLNLPGSVRSGLEFGTLGETPSSSTSRWETLGLAPSPAPRTVILSGPVGATADNDPGFTYTSSDTGSSFECRLDSASFASCPAQGKSYTNLADGPHTFEVVAIDPDGNIDATPASRSFTVDTQAPNAPTLTDTDPDSPANVRNPRVKGSAEQDSAVRLYEGSGCTSGPIATGSASQLSGTGIEVFVLDGRVSHIRATATDVAGNVSPCSNPIAYAEESDTCFEPVPSPIAAGWTVEGNQAIQGGAAPLLINDGSTALAGFVSLFCLVEDELFSNEIVLRPRLSIDSGFSAAADNTSVHITIGDGSREIRAVLLAVGPGALRVAIDLGGGGFSQGFTFGSLNADFILKRLSNGNAVLALPTGETEEVGRFSLPASSRKALEFGTLGDAGSSSVSRWERLGLPPLLPTCRNTPSAIVPPIKADGSSSFPLGLPVLIAIRVTDCSGAVVDSLAPRLALEKIAPDQSQVTKLVSTVSGEGAALRFLFGHYAYALSTQQSRLTSGQRVTAGRYRLTISDPSFVAPVAAEFSLRR